MSCESCGTAKVSAIIHFDDGTDKSVCIACAKAIEAGAETQAKVGLLAKLCAHGSSGPAPRAQASSLNWQEFIPELQMHIALDKAAKSTAKAAAAPVAKAPESVFRVKKAGDDSSLGSSAAQLRAPTLEVPAANVTATTRGSRRKSVAVVLSDSYRAGFDAVAALDEVETDILALLAQAGLKGASSVLCDSCRKRSASQLALDPIQSQTVCTLCAERLQREDTARQLTLAPLPDGPVDTPVFTTESLMSQLCTNCALWTMDALTGSADDNHTRLEGSAPLRYVTGALVDNGKVAMPVYGQVPQERPDGKKAGAEDSNTDETSGEMSLSVSATGVPTGTYLGVVSLDQCTYYVLEKYDTLRVDTNSFMAGSLDTFVAKYAFAELAPKSVLNTDSLYNVIVRGTLNRPVGLTESTLEDAPIDRIVEVSQLLEFVAERGLKTHDDLLKAWPVNELECFVDRDVCLLSVHLRVIDALRMLRRHRVPVAAVVNNAGGLVAAFSPHCLRYISSSTFKLLELPLGQFYSELTKLFPSSVRIAVDPKSGAMDMKGVAKKELGAAHKSVALKGLLDPLYLSATDPGNVSNAIQLLRSPANVYRAVFIVAGGQRVVAVLRADRLLRRLCINDARSSLAKVPPPPAIIEPTESRNRSRTSSKDSYERPGTPGRNRSPKSTSHRRRTESVTAEDSPRPSRLSGRFFGRLRRQSSTVSSIVASSRDGTLHRDDSRDGLLNGEYAMKVFGVRPANHLLGSSCLSLLLAERPDDGVPRVVSLSVAYLQRNVHVLDAYAPMDEPPSEAKELAAWFDDELGGAFSPRSEPAGSPRNGKGNSNREALVEVQSPLPADLTSPRALAALLWMWLDSLSAPFLPPRVQALLVSAANMASRDARMTRFYFALASLPPAEQLVLSSLLKLLHQVALDKRNSGKGALARVAKFFAPVLLKSKEIATTGTGSNIAANIELTMQALVLDSEGLCSHLSTRKQLWEAYPVLKRIDITADLQNSATHKGYLLKKSSKDDDKWMRRFFFVAAPYLIYYHDESDARPSGILSLADARTTVAARDPKGEKAAWQGQFVVTTPEKTLVLTSEDRSVEQASVWIAALKKAVAQAQAPESND